MVRWTPTAEQELADIWLKTSDRMAVTLASNTIDRLLAQDPERRGIPRFDTVRTFAIHPIVVDFEVIDQDLTVYVLSVWDISQTQS
jgi:hypothetical protein